MKLMRSTIAIWLAILICYTEGIGGLVAAKYASEVLITDGNELVMQAVRENIEKNPSSKMNTIFITIMAIIYQRPSKDVKCQ